MAPLVGLLQRSYVPRIALVLLVVLVAFTAVFGKEDGRSSTAIMS
jgi:hypothetical protein